MHLEKSNPGCTTRVTIQQIVPAGYKLVKWDISEGNFVHILDVFLRMITSWRPFQK